VSLERTLTIIKPDGVEQRNAGDIVKKFEESRLRIVAAKVLHLTRQQAEGFYAVHREKGFFNDLTRYMSSGPIMVMVLEGENAINCLRELMGATDPSKAAEGTIRKLYATSIERNVIHGSDGPDTARNEISYFFASLELI
jgi:nucleoside-diphosphate kinase